LSRAILDTHAQQPRPPAVLVLAPVLHG
jgi:hypothetical protein